MRTSAKKSLFNEALIFILELLSQVKSEFFDCSLSRLSPVVNRNGRKDGVQHLQGSHKEYINRDCIKS